MGMAADDRAGVQHAVAADLHMIAQHRPHLFAACVHALLTADTDHVGLVGFHIGGDRARAHVGLVAQDAVAHIVVVGRLYAVEQDDVLQLHGVAHHAARAHQGAAPDERAVAHLRVRADDARSAQEGRGRDPGGLMYPHVRGGAFVVRSQRRAEGQDQVGDAGQRLPGIGKAGQIIPRQRVCQVKQIMNGIHTASSCRALCYCTQNAEMICAQYSANRAVWQVEGQKTTPEGGFLKGSLLVQRLHGRDFRDQP